MTGADGVDIERTHQFQVLQNLFTGDVVARELVMFMVIHAFELDRLAVHIEDVAFYLQAAEAHVETGVLPFRFEQKGIEFGGFCCPAAHSRNTQILYWGDAGGYCGAVGIQKFEPYRNGGCKREDAVGEALVESGDDAEVLKGRGLL